VSDPIFLELTQKDPQMSIKLKLATTLVSVALGAIAAPSAMANIIADPGFELNNGSWFASNFSIGNVGARHTGTNAAETPCVGHTCVTTQGAGAFIRQTLTTVAAQTYNLSFWVGENAGPNSELSVFWNGAQVADILNPANNTIPPGGAAFVQFSFPNLLATGGSTVLEVHGRQDPATIFFDDFSVEAVGVAAVPEPVSLALLGLGLAGLGWSRRKQA
jgi:PEP-CTERM motif